MPDSSSVLLVFVKNPRPGKVKTRLAESVGKQRAMQIYRLLLQYTMSIVEPLDTDVQVWYSDFIPSSDIWGDAGMPVERRRQQGSDLGKRMKNAFARVFKESYHKAVVIGSDCGELTTEILGRAFDVLSIADVVIGPAQDGGYYLLGMKEEQPDLFDDKAWSTPDLLRQTLQQIENKSLTYILLPQLNDVDTEADWQKVKDEFTD